LDSSAYRVQFACGDKYRKLIEDSGYKTYPLPTIPSEVFLGRLAQGIPLYTYEDLTSYVTAETELLSAISPDLVIGDFRISLGISCDRLGIPYANLSNAHWSPYSTLAFPVPELGVVRILGVSIVRRLLPKLLPFIFWQHSRSFNRLRKLYGLQPVGNMKHVYTYGTWTLYADLPSLAPTSDLPANHAYIGPIIWSPEIPLPDWWGNLPQDKPLIYVTMGSSGDIDCLGAIVGALQQSSYAGIIATAGRKWVETTARNIYQAEYLPGLEVIEKASMVLCNGGSATAYQALSRGVPVLGLPSNADQFFTMGAIERLGAGILVRSGDVSLKNVRDAMDRILNDSSYKNAADRISREIAAHNCVKLFPEFIDRMTP
jgi:UDP:flavonoid glycosyltransferase YjiC (YdhE family)